MTTATTTTTPTLLLATTGATIISGNTFYMELLSAFFSLRWAILFMVLLVLTDFWSGLAASVKVKKEKFRWSRAMRRTMRKFLEYICYIILAMLLTKSILVPFGVCTEMQGAAIGAAIALFVEANSIYGHVCALHGIKTPPSIKRFFVAYLKRRNQDIGSAVEEAMKEAESGEKEKAEETKTE